MLNKDELTTAFLRSAKDIPDSPLTEGEVGLLKGIFGGSIKTSRIRKHFAPEDKQEPNTVAGAIGKKDIYFFGEHNHLDDYSRSADPFIFSAFIHEMTHVWQYQHTVQDFIRLLLHPDDNFNYDYELSPKARFRDFGTEQQACIMQDYAVQFLYPDQCKIAKTDDGSYLPSETSTGNSQSLDLLQQVVEKRFPRARKTRLALEEQQQTSCPNRRRPKMG